MEIGYNSDGLTLSGLGSGTTEDDHEGSGASPSLAPFLARLSRDERLGWTSSRSRADDTDSLNVNVSDCGSCRLSEVSSVSSWLNDAPVVDDDYSSCAPDDETGSEKDDIDEDEDDNGPEIRPLFLLQRCLEEKLLERQQNSDVLPAECAVYTHLSELSSLQYDKSEVETSTIKRASQNLCTFKYSETADNSVPGEGHSVSDTNGVLYTSTQSMPLHHSKGSRCNPDSLICTGAIYNFNSNSNVQSVNSEVVNVNGSDTVEDTQHSVQTQQHVHQPQCNSHSIRDLSSEAQFIQSTAPIKAISETPLWLPTVLKNTSSDKYAACVDNKLTNRASEQNKSTIGTCSDTQHAHIANGSACRKQSSDGPCPTYNKTAIAGDSNLDSTSLKSNCSNCQTQSTAMMFVRHNSPSSNQQEVLQCVTQNNKSVTVEPLEETPMIISGETSAENIDAASVVSDEVEKASDPACSLAMPVVEDGLSNSDISDVDEAFSMFAGVKPPVPVPVDASCGTKSPVASDATKTTKDLDGSTADAHSVSSL